MPRSLGQIDAALSRIQQRLDLGFRWFRGNTIPEVRNKELVLFEDSSEGVAKLLARIGPNKYIDRRPHPIRDTVRV
jgi:hypothetical protein